MQTIFIIFYKILQNYILEKLQSNSLEKIRLEKKLNISKKTIKILQKPNKYDIIWLKY